VKTIKLAMIFAQDVLWYTSNIVKSYWDFIII